MPKFELKLPQMGESIAEATLTSWLKEVGDTIEVDEAVFEIATDKVDSEVPSEVEGTLLEKCFNVDDVIKVGEIVAVIHTEGETEKSVATAENLTEGTMPPTSPVTGLEGQINQIRETIATSVPDCSSSQRFYSPLVRNIAKKEGISADELEAMVGTGKEGRVTKNDIKAFLHSRPSSETTKETLAKQGSLYTEPADETKAMEGPSPKMESFAIPAFEGGEIIPLTRMGKLTAKHMAESVATSVHVQSFVEVDVTNVVNWRDKVKKAFEVREGEKLTFTPIFMEAVAMALKKHPLVNISLEGDNIVKKKNINLGMAAALPDGNLIVPVIKNADQLNLVGMAKTVNDLAKRARNNELKPDEVQGGTYTVTNVGMFGSVFGTPIINQPQVGILALGAIRKMPSVIETDKGEYIGIRSKMFLSHSYDHRVVNGALGGMFVKTVADYLEAWDVARET